MHLVLWSGRSPDRKLVELLRGQGVRVVDKADGPVVAEVVTGAARGAPADGRGSGVPWIWFAPAVVSADDASAAIARGAYDVIDARGPGAASVLVQRIAELAAVEPSV